MPLVKPSLTFPSVLWYRGDLECTGSSGIVKMTQFHVRGRLEGGKKVFELC